MPPRGDGKAMPQACRAWEGEKLPGKHHQGDYKEMLPTLPQSNDCSRSLPITIVFYDLPTFYQKSGNALRWSAFLCYSHSMLPLHRLTAAWPPMSYGHDGG